jgi:hypothetical protein
MVCNLLVHLLLGFASEVNFGPEALRNRDRNVLSHVELPQPGRPVPRFCIHQEQGDPFIPPGTASHF